MSTRTVGRVLKYLVLAFSTLIVGVFAWGYYLNWNLKQWDAKMDALCSANGGRDVEARIYETVMAPLTKEYFSALNPPRLFFLPERSKGQDLGIKYPYVYETRVLQVLNQKNPSVVKFTERIVRVIDKKIMAERFAYQRAGGGVPGMEPGEIRVCPIITTEKRLDVQVFLNHPHHNYRSQ